MTKADEKKNAEIESKEELWLCNDSNEATIRQSSERKLLERSELTVGTYVPETNFTCGCFDQTAHVEDTASNNIVSAEEINQQTADEILNVDDIKQDMANEAIHGNHEELQDQPLEENLSVQQTKGETHNEVEEEKKEEEVIIPKALEDHRAEESVMPRGATTACPNEENKSKNSADDEAVAEGPSEIKTEELSSAARMVVEASSVISGEAETLTAFRDAEGSSASTGIEGQQIAASISHEKTAYNSGIWLFSDRENISYFFEPNFLPPYDTPYKRKIILDVLREEWDEETLSWKACQAKTSEEPSDENDIVVVGESKNATTFPPASLKIDGMLDDLMKNVRSCFPSEEELGKMVT